MEMRKGLVVEIGGTDGSGKATQAELLAELLTNAGCNVKVIPFPQHNEVSGALVDEFLYKGLKLDGAPMTKAIREGMLYAVDRMVTMTKLDNDTGKSIAREIEEGTVIILDRYVASNYLHRTREFEDIDLLKVYMDTMDMVEYELLLIPKPDITLILNVEPEVAYQNVLNRGRELDENETLENITKSNETISKICELRNYEEVICSENGQMKDKVVICNEIMEKILNKLNNIHEQD